MVELIASLLALQQGRLFRTLNYETPDPDCPVAVVRDGRSRRARVSSISASRRRPRPAPC